MTKSGSAGAPVDENVYGHKGTRRPAFSVWMDHVELPGSKLAEEEDIGALKHTFYVSYFLGVDLTSCLLSYHAWFHEILTSR